MSDQDHVTILSWPCSSISLLSLTILFMVIRASYVLGENSREKKPVKLATYWTYCGSCLLLMCLWSVIKFVD